MPVARGITQIGRINVYPTTTTMVSINPPDVGFCGETITFTVAVSNNRGISFPVPTGSVLIKDRTTGATLASGTLSAGTAIINSTISISSNQIYAQYVGVVNSFGASQSAPDIPYNISLIDTLTTVTNTTNTNFCFHNNFNLTAHVDPLTATTISASSGGASLPQSTINVISTGGFQSSGTIFVASSNGFQTVNYTGKTATAFTGCSGGTGTLFIGNLVKGVSTGLPVTVGSIQINLYTDPIAFTTIGTVAVNGSGNVTVILPADTTVPGNTYYIQAKYLGASCFGVSSSPIGTGGKPIHSKSLTQNTTTTTVNSIGSFCINSSKTITATVGSAFLGGPSIGSVTFTAVKSPTTLNLGTDSSVSAGAASINVPGGTFPSTGNWTVTAAYTGDGYCFANSNSVGVTATPSTFPVTMNISVGSEFFCRATAQTFTYVVSSSFSGTINGTFVLKSSFGTTLKTVSTSGSSGGFNVSFSVSANTFLTGTQDIFVEFTPAGGSCYSASTSGDFSVIVRGSSNQSPSSTTLSISPASGSSATTFMFTITVNKGGGAGPLDGAGSLNGSASIYWFDSISASYVLLNNNVHIFDYGSYGSGSYSASGFPSSATSAKAIWNGNACYAFQESASQPMDVFNFPH